MGTECGGSLILIQRPIHGHARVARSHGDAIAKCIVQSLGLSVETEQTWAESPGERYRRSGLGQVVLDGTEGTTLSVQSDAQLHWQNRS